MEGEERNRVVGGWKVESHDREVDKKDQIARVIQKKI